MKLVIARPSLFARKVRIALIEKGLDCEEIMDVPWNAGTSAPAHNPLGKIPILLLDDGTKLFDSKVIVEFLDTLDAPPRLIPEAPRERIAVRQIEALADGISDAVVLIVLEASRKSELRSRDWIARQRAKVEAGTADLAQRLGNRQHFVGDDLTLADITSGAALAYLDLRLPEFEWRPRHPELVAFSAAMEARPSFARTKPEPQPIATVE